MKTNRMPRVISDRFLQLLTVLSAALAVVVLTSLFVYIFSHGLSLINADLLRSDYWSLSKIVALDESRNQPGNYPRPENLGAEVAWSEKWGVGFVDHLSHEKKQLVLIETVAENSPLASAVDTSAGANQGKTVAMSAGLQVEKIDFTDASGTADFTGMLASASAAEVAETLDRSAAKLTSMFIKTPGGGIRGSLVSTAYLILVSLLIALPIGIASAVYLSEMAKKNKVNAAIRTGIETLTGVPSIVYGLMGVSVLFPITAAMGAKTTNILLGALTMAIILLPTIIRSTEEALRVVPQGLRDASLSLGASQTQTIFKITLPCAMPGILSGILLSIGRVVGESAALIYTMGTFINDQPGLLKQGTSLAVHIWSVMSGEQPNFELACAISIIILIFVLILNLTVKLLSRRLQKSFR
ncbi:phosphate ABC transporter permease PstA [Holdemania filiformis]|uniref:phosphate ABC transporter permease PstA n=1 Tax=Holdemania filiformis TaxID=61171 RepID=UPI0026707010|nr:phosphate ABC transporter permease PstA [Holdemania filiformis]